jgi:hypothetical protein
VQCWIGDTLDRLIQRNDGDISNKVVMIRTPAWAVGMPHDARHIDRCGIIIFVSDASMGNVSGCTLR